MSAPAAAAALEELRAAAATCTRCRLYERATWTVFGEGPPGAPLMLVGEQPGDREDVEGRPFVGPAGRLLDRALAGAGIDRGAVYVTNAVKHFKWVERGKRRIHQTPLVGEINACLPWLDAEMEVVNPRIVVAMGATAVRALFGPAARLTRMRGERLELPGGREGYVTVHPSSILRVQDADQRHLEMSRLVDDLSLVARRLPAA
ncbi:MAG: UdgX family uracil-DNA binding protein [Chloroflexi bacterium]|nr:MAG: UdgX family uracil-DNA binding protein [Chloroflexota bacterium]